MERGRRLDGREQPVLLIGSKAVFPRRRFHRQKAHLVEQEQCRGMSPP